ncbi:MAG: DUF3221 domain-containing protein [Thermoanaerobaculia bacterium]
MFRGALVLIALVGLVSCNSAPVATGAPVVADEGGGVRGTVTRVTPAEEPGDVLGRILIEANPAEERGSAKDSVTITKATTIEVRRDGALHAAQFSDLRTGQVVHGWSDGAIMKSYPAQWNAKRIVIEE